MKTSVAASMQRSTLLSSLGILILFVCKSSEFVQCYYPDGSIPTDFSYVPCTSNPVSSCCIPLEGDVCQDNGLCYYPASRAIYRAACTDQTWKSSGCPQVCVTGKKLSFIVIVDIGISQVGILSFNACQGSKARGLCLFCATTVHLLAGDIMRRQLHAQLELKRTIPLRPPRL